MTKPNETDSYKQSNNTGEHTNQICALWTRTAEPEPKQIWMIATGAWNLGSGLHSLICGASELTYCGTTVGCRMRRLHNFPCFHGRQKGGAGWAFEIWYFPINFSVEKCFSPSFELVKWNFTAVAPLGKMFLVTTWRNVPLPPWPPWKKSFQCPWSFMCRSGLLKRFCTCPNIHQIGYII